MLELGYDLCGEIVRVWVHLWRVSRLPGVSRSWGDARLDEDGARISRKLILAPAKFNTILVNFSRNLHITLPSNAASTLLRTKSRSVNFVGFTTTAAVR